MKKYLLFFIGAFCVLNPSFAEEVVLSDTYAADDSYNVEEPLPTTSNDTYQNKQKITPSRKSLLVNDTSDPLYFIGDNQFLSDTFVYFYDEHMRLGQYIGYGINNNFTVHTNMHYQFDFSGEHENGFSATEFGGEYRMNHGTGRMRLISDALFGLKAWGSSHVRTPEYADSSYYAGLRFGRQYTGITLAGTVKSTWVFDNARGLSYIDFIPEAYFRFQYGLRAGIGFDLRKSTNTHLLEDQEWLNLKFLRQYGNTQYVGHIDYEFDKGKFQLGFDVKVLF